MARACSSSFDQQSSKQGALIKRVERSQSDYWGGECSRVEAFRRHLTHFNPVTGRVIYGHPMQIAPFSRGLSNKKRRKNRANSPRRFFALVTLQASVLVQMAEEVFQLGELLVPRDCNLPQYLEKGRYHCEDIVVHG